MTQSEFVCLSLQYCIDPRFSLENEKIIEALQNRDDEEVERILRDEF